MKAKIFVGGAATGKTRVARMIAEFIGNEKAYICSARGISMDNIGNLFNSLSVEHELIIIDDCEEDFDFQTFFPLIDRYNGDFGFRFFLEKKHKKPRVYFVKKMIFITETLPSELEQSRAFNDNFNVIRFPLSSEKGCQSLYMKGIRK